MAVKFMLPDHHDASSDTQGQIVGRRGNWSGVLLSPQSAPRSAPRSPRMIVMRTFAHVRMQYRSSESWNASRARSRSPPDAFPVASAFSFVVPFFAFAPHTQRNASGSGTQRAFWRKRIRAQTRSMVRMFTERSVFRLTHIHSALVISVILNSVLLSVPYVHLSNSLLMLGLFLMFCRRSKLVTRSKCSTSTAADWTTKKRAFSSATCWTTRPWSRSVRIVATVLTLVTLGTYPSSRHYPGHARYLSQQLSLPWSRSVPIPATVVTLVTQCIS